MNRYRALPRISRSADTRLRTAHSEATARLHTCRVDLSFILLVLVIVTALAFDFTNGFHDTGNAMATSIATGALKPKVAVALSGILNLIGAFLSVEVALTVTNAVIKIQAKDGAPKPEFLADHGQALLLIVLAGLVGGIVWNLLTWLLGIPSSSSHALFGGLIGSAIAAIGMAGVKWTGDGSKLDGVVGKVIIPAFLSPFIAAVVGALMWYLGDVIGGGAGGIVVFAILCAFAAYMFYHSRKTPVDHNNVNEEWDPQDLAATHIPDVVAESDRNTVHPATKVGSR